MAEVALFKGTVLRITSVPTGTAEGAAFALAGTGLERGSAIGRPTWIEIDGLDAAALSGADASNRKVPANTPMAQGKDRPYPRARA